MKKGRYCYLSARVVRLLVCVYVLACGMVAYVAEAQETFDVEVMLRKKVKKADGTIGLDTIERGDAWLFFNRNDANRCVAGKIESTEKTAIDIDKKWKFSSVSKGAFIVVQPEYGIDPMKRHLFEVQKGQTEYVYDYSVDDDSRIIENITVRAKYKAKTKKIKPGAPWEDGDKITWEILSILDRAYLKDASRFMFVPKAFEYPSNEFVQNIPPAVYDTEDYMKAQVRRKSYDYEINDSLVKYILYKDPKRLKDADKLAVDSTLILNDDVFICKYRFVFKMPNVNSYYYYKGVRELEDYSHVYFADTVRSSYLRKKPWRFLATEFAVQYGDLADSLYVSPKVQVRNEPRTLALVFRNNTAQLENNENNDSILKEVDSDMRAYRKSLQQVTVIGSASPEGSRERNVHLANERAAFAVRYMRDKYGVNAVKGEPIVYDWSAVTDRLKEMGRMDIVNAIEARIESGGKVTKDIMEWNETIEPILSELRAMSCTYTIRLNKPLEPMQAVDKFLHDPDFAEGGSKSFSLGDYFNIYKYCKDTLAMEKLTERIYRTEIKPYRNQARYEPFYAYVANRHLADKLKHGTIDKDSPGILVGFVNLDTLRGGHLYSEVAGVKTREKARVYKINRSDHVANLALAYFGLKKYSLADTLSQLLPESPALDKKYNAVKMLSLLCSRFLSHPEEAEPGLDYAWNASPLSRAVLAVELKEKLEGNRRLAKDSLMNLLWSLPDVEPRKWYLLALETKEDSVTNKYANPYIEILSEKKKRIADMEDEAGIGGFGALMSSPAYKALEAEIDSLEALSRAAGKPCLKDSLPDFCAYLQHAFDLDSNYYHIHYKTDYDFDEYINRVKQEKKQGVKVTDYQYIPKYAADYRRRFEDIMSYRKSHPEETGGAAAVRKDDEQSGTY